MNRVLVLCQRKTGRVSKTDADDVSNTTLVYFTKFLSPFIESPSFEYLSDGLVEVDGTADYNFKLGYNTETERFIKENEKKYKAVVFQTCPIPAMKDIIFLVYTLLEEDGLVIFTAINKREKERGIQLTSNIDMYGTFIEDLDKYFDKTDVPFIYKKKSLP